MEEFNVRYIKCIYTRKSVSLTVNKVYKCRGEESGLSNMVDCYILLNDNDEIDIINKDWFIDHTIQYERKLKLKKLK